MWQFFKPLNFPSHCLSSNPSQPKIIFHSNPIIFKQKSLQNHFKVCFSKHCFHFSFNFADFSLGFQNWGFFFSKMGWNFYDYAIFLQNLWLGWVPFDVFASVLAPCGILSMYWGIFHHVHALFIVEMHCCTLGVCQNVLVTFLCWIGIKWVPIPVFVFWLNMLDMFWSLDVCFYTLCSFCASMPCHAMHTLGTH